MRKKSFIALALILSVLLCGCVTAGGGTDTTGGNTTQGGGTTQGSNTTPSGGETGATNATGPADPPVPSKRDSIPFTEGQLYAVAYLGYQEIADFDYYVEKYLDTADVPTYTVSDGDFYLVIPRYDGMTMALSVNDLETSQSNLRQEVPNVGPFIVQCNVSDVFSDATIALTYNGDRAEFTPFISLENGAPQIGERGLDITKPGSSGPSQPAGEADLVGEYTDAESGAPGLEIARNDDGIYTVQISIVHLAQFTDGVGRPEGEGLAFTATDPGGNPIAGTVTLSGTTATVTFTDSTWTYIPNGESFTYEKASDTPNLWARS